MAMRYEIVLYVQKASPAAPCHLAITDAVKITPVKFPIITQQIIMCKYLIITEQT